MKHFLILIILASLNSSFAVGQTDPVFKEVDHILWVVEDLKAVRKGWANIGFTEVEELKKVKLISHGLKDDKGSIKAAVAHLGGARAMWIQPVNGSTIFSRYLERKGEGAVALIHKVESQQKLQTLVSKLARVNIGKIATYTLETKTGNLKYTIMDTKDRGKYYLGFVIDERSGSSSFKGKNQQNLVFSQYAFAIKDEVPVSSFWQSAGLPEMEITHGPIRDKKYLGGSANFDMKLGWQRHGSVVYEWIIPIKPPSVYYDYMRKHGEGIQHFGMRSTDIDRDIIFFNNLGYEITMSGAWGEEGKPGSGRFAYIDLEAIGGMTIELLWSYRQ